MCPVTVLIIAPVGICQDSIVTFDYPSCKLSVGHVNSHIQDCSSNTLPSTSRRSYPISSYLPVNARIEGRHFYIRINTEDEWTIPESLNSFRRNLSRYSIYDGVLEFVLIRPISATHTTKST